MDFALLSDRWKCFAISLRGWRTSSSKPKAIPEIGFLSLINHFQSRMDFFVGFLCNENLLWVLYSGICYKFMLSLILALFDLIQTNDTVQIFWLQR